jgi:integrase
MAIMRRREIQRIASPAAVVKLNRSGRLPEFLWLLTDLQDDSRGVESVFLIAIGSKRIELSAEESPKYVERSGWGLACEASDFVNLRLGTIKPVDVEAWLRQIPLVRGTCAKIRNIMSVLFNHARRHDFFDSNPIQLVRQGGKRRATPSVLQDHEIRQLLGAVDSLTRILIFTVATTGLRQSELFGLRWCDIDFETGQINVVRSVVHGHVSNTARPSLRPSQYRWAGNSLRC